MKTVNYSLSEQDKINIKKCISSHIRKCNADYEKNPDHYYTNNKSELNKRWLTNANSKAMFELFVNDGLCHIKKEKDDFYTFADHAGDCYCPKINNDIDSKELKRQEKNERARFNRQGCFVMTLVVLDDEVDSICGFVGNDFYGSGYDFNFYTTAFELLRDNELTADYVREIIDFIINLSASN